MANIKIFGNILSYATPSASGDLVPKWYVDALADVPDKTTMTNIPSATFTPTYSGQVFYKNATTNVTLSPSVSNVTVSSGQFFEYYIVIKSNAKTVSFPGTWKWSGGSAPSTATEGTYIIHVFTTDAKSKWRAELVGVYTDSYNLKFTVQVTANKTVDFTNWYYSGNTLPSSTTIDWGDGTAKTVTTDPYGITHTYTNAGTYQIKMSSVTGELVFPGFEDDGSCLRSVDYVSTTWVGADDLNFSDNGMFKNCSNLTSIPANIFASLTTQENFAGCFDGCSSLTSIPNGLFSANANAINFNSCFRNCSSITSIPANLFTTTKLSGAQNFSSCFNGCSSLTSIPATLFTLNTNATNFYGCFKNCTSITSVPATLFSTNTNVTHSSGVFNDSGFISCFEGCTSLTTVSPTMFSIESDYSKCFYNCSSLVPSDTAPYLPQVWEDDTYAMGFTSSTPNTYGGSTSTAVKNLVPSPYGGNIGIYSQTNTYAQGSHCYAVFAKSEIRNAYRVYTYIDSTPHSSNNSHDTSNTNYWVPGYDVPGSTVSCSMVFKNQIGGIGMKSFEFTYDGTTLNGTPPNGITWTGGSFNSASGSGSYTGTANALMMSNWSLNNGILSITFGMGATQFPISADITNGTVITFNNFTETSGMTTMYFENNSASNISCYIASSSTYTKS